MEMLSSLIKRIIPVVVCVGVTATRAFAEDEDTALIPPVDDVQWVGDAAAIGAVADVLDLQGEDFSDEERMEVLNWSMRELRRHPENFLNFPQIIARARPLSDEAKDQVLRFSIEMLETGAWQVAQAVRRVVMMIGTMSSGMKEDLIAAFLESVKKTPQNVGYLQEMITTVGVMTDSLKERCVESLIVAMRKDPEVIYSMGDIVESLGGVSDSLKRTAIREAFEVARENPNVLRYVASVVQKFSVELTSEERRRLLGWTMKLAESERNSEWDYTSDVSVCVTNVIVHQVTTNALSRIMDPLPFEPGYVVATTEIKGGIFVVPDVWASLYAGLVERYGGDLVAALKKPTGKRLSDGTAAFVWQDYVAGTDPTDVNDVFKASVAFDEGKPVVSWTPELKPEQASLRKYTVYGKARLTDSEWTVVDGNEADFNFFKVTVEMR